MQTESFIPGKDASELAARASALGEFFQHDDAGRLRLAVCVYRG
jgi:ribosomal protein S12 methylthiotransferase accessory factor YcaO